MNVCILGGGAAGLMAAVTAARLGHRVTLMERQSRVGRKLAATGNGRCNLTNTHLDLSHYHGARREALAPALSCLDGPKTLALFHELGLLTVTEPSGRVYPRSDQAGSVVDVLRFAAEGAGAEIRTGIEVTALRRQNSAFSLSWSGGRLTSEKLILCCGGAAGAHLGGGSWGYDLLSALGHRITPLIPALCPIRTETAFVRSLKGVRAQAAAAVRRGRETLAEETGEIQFTETGVSGPAAFALSRWASAGTTLHLDLLPERSREALAALLKQRQKALPHLTLENLLTGMLHNRLGRTVVRHAGLSLSQGLSALTAGDIARIAAAVKDVSLPVLGTAGFAAAQVTAGGADLGDFDPKTLESRLVPGLFAAGEVLDADGDCGGYNLQWAWSSGYLAGHLGRFSGKETWG